MRIKTTELIGPALDWAVAMADNRPVFMCKGVVVDQTNGIFGEMPTPFRPSTDWRHGGPIIERADISFRKYHRPDSPTHGTYYAKICMESGTIIYWSKKTDYTGPTPLIAAMRCYVASRLGGEIEVPDELLA